MGKQCFILCCDHSRLFLFISTYIKKSLQKTDILDVFPLGLGWHRDSLQRERCAEVAGRAGPPSGSSAFMSRWLFIDTSHITISKISSQPFFFFYLHTETFLHASPARLAIRWTHLIMCYATVCVVVLLRRMNTFSSKKNKTIWHFHKSECSLALALLSTRLYLLL